MPEQELADLLEIEEGDSDDDLPLGEAPGPETLPSPLTFDQAERQERIWRYHEDVVTGRAIRFIPKAEILQPPPGTRRKPRRSPDIAKSKVAQDTIRAIFASFEKELLKP
jgi:hypothetical protein